MAWKDTSSFDSISAGRNEGTSGRVVFQARTPFLSVVAPTKRYEIFRGEYEEVGRRCGMPKCMKTSENVVLVLQEAEAEMKEEGEEKLKQKY